MAPMIPLTVESVLMSIVLPWFVSMRSCQTSLMVLAFARSSLIGLSCGGGASTTALADGAAEALADARGAVADALGAADDVVLGGGACGSVGLPQAMIKPSKV